jgi:hypothetical protein
VRNDVIADTGIPALSNIENAPRCQKLIMWRLRLRLRTSMDSASRSRSKESYSDAGQAACDIEIYAGRIAFIGGACSGVDGHSGADARLIGLGSR